MTTPNAHTKQPTPVTPTRPDDGASRRDFIRTSLLVGAAAAAGWSSGCAAGGKRQKWAAPFPVERGDAEPMRVGVIGCGGRGTGAAINCIDSSPGVTIAALGDLFPDRLDRSRAQLLKDRADACSFTDASCFTGFDNYRRVLECDIDMVILATPPHFRPIHLTAAVEAGKHVFTEKPVAVDPVGVRTVIAAAELAEQKGLGLVAGTQRRHDPRYLEVMNRVLAGDIGEVVGGQCYWNMGGLWVVDPKPEFTEMEWQCRNWLYFTWLSGDHIVEQHIHNIDVLNWALGGPPVKVVGMGGRQSRTEPKYGNIFDHFAVEYEYANGARVLSMCRQAQGASSRVTERIVGTQGVAIPDQGRIEGAHPFEFVVAEGAEEINPYVQEHADLIGSIRHGQPLNEGVRVAESNLTAIMGRMSAYTGRELKWEWALNSSKLDLSPTRYAFGPNPVPPVAIPGQTELV